MSQRYRSKLEELTAALLKKNKIKFEYEARRIPFRSRIKSGECPSEYGGCGSKDVYQKRTYLPDFTLPDGTIVESKGKLTPSERTKFLAIKSSNPELRIVFVFGANNKLSKGNPDRRYSHWCDEHGFEYGVKALPASLIKGS